MDTRTCVKCELEYPIEYFAIVNKKNGRRKTVCKYCIKDYQKQYRLENKVEKIREPRDTMYEIKEEPLATKKHRMLKAFNTIHLQAFGEAMTENIYWCKKDDCVQITEDICGSCNKKMEKIGFVDYAEDDAE